MGSQLLCDPVVFPHPQGVGHHQLLVCPEVASNKGSALILLVFLARLMLIISEEDRYDVNEKTIFLSQIPFTKCAACGQEVAQKDCQQSPVLVIPYTFSLLLLLFLR